MKIGMIALVGLLIALPAAAAPAQAAGPGTASSTTPPAAPPATTPAAAPPAAPAPAPATPAGQGKAMEQPATSGAVTRATFTTDVKNREPVDHITTLTNTASKVYFFTELTGLAGQRVTHRWLHEGKVVAQVSFQVKGPRWRVWSSKELLPGWTGLWTVQVVTADGHVLLEDQLTYRAAAG